MADYLGSVISSLPIEDQAEVAGMMAEGGIIPGYARDDDLIPALLSPGCPLIYREQAEALGLTAEAKRLPSCADAGAPDA